MRVVSRNFHAKILINYWRTVIDHHLTGSRWGSITSTLGNLLLNQSPTIENIQSAYKEGESAKARDLVRLSCEGTKCKVEKYELLNITAAYGDLEMVQYLLQEAQVELPRKPSDENPAVVAAYCGHKEIVREFLNSLPDSSKYKDLLSWMLATACKQGHLEVVQLLVREYKADTDSCAMKADNLPVITGSPLRIFISLAGNEEIAGFLLQNGALFSSYIIMDHPEFSKRLLRKYFTEESSKYQDTLTQTGLSLKWSELKLPWLELDWFMDISSQITELDLHANNLTFLPSIIPWGLVHVKKLNLSENHLKELPNTASSEEILCTGILEIDVSRNQLTCLPSGFLHLTKLQKLTAFRNAMDKLFDEQKATNWIGLRKLQAIDISENKLECLPTIFVHCFKSLISLNASQNALKQIPEPWACPLESCNMSQNLLEQLPSTLCVFWRKSLKEADFGDNLLKEVPQNLFELQALHSMRLCGNQLAVLPCPDKWQCVLLKSLDLSKNQLGNPCCLISVPSVEFPQFLGECLEVLHLDNNFLDSVPQSVCWLKSLSELYLSNNPGIRDLPPELGQLANLWQLDIEELNITNVSAEVRKEGPVSVLGYLRAQLRKAEPCKLLKMIIVGPPRQGKSTLLEVLHSGKPPQAMLKENSIQTTTWELQRPAAVKAKVDSIAFNVWDVGGPVIMSTVNQCFFTDMALYVVVWNLALGEEAVANLQSWLLNIEAKASNATVIVVGTHLDLIDMKFRTERIATLRAFVLALCRAPSGTRATGYPDVICKNLHEFSGKTLEGLEGLRKLIFQVACNMKEVGQLSGSQKLVGRLIPRSHLSLLDAVIKERKRRSASNEVLYLTDQQLEAIMEQMPDNDIEDFQDLQSAISFLIQTGALLHFPDTSHGLRNLYFLDPVWLSECLERIINIKASRSVAKNGVIQTKDLRMLLVGTGFTEQTEEQYFQFLAKFEIALPVANNSYLLPHLLPSKPGLDINNLRHKFTNTIQRLFKMTFVPVGFWQRFIARILISLAQMDVQLFENEKNSKPTRNNRASLYSFTGSQRRNRCSTFRVRRTQTIYWQEGLQINYDGGYLSVQSSEVNWKKTKSGGIKIICQSESRDFSAVAFLTDHVNSLFDQWFPALTATETDGTLLVEQYMPCPSCTPTTEGETHTQLRPDGLNYFKMEDCVLTAIAKTHIECPNHPSTPVSLEELVPELFMTDFPSRLFLEISKLEYSEMEKHVLGQGGSGTIIYKAMYKGIPIAVKRFHFKRLSAVVLFISDSMFRHIEAMEALRNFSEFRQEASMLHSLQHPCIVSLIGISIHPLCFALELAPLGSLNTVLAEYSKGMSFMPLGHMLTYRIAYQIAVGLSYLHRKHIIFCDLKSDNILVWTLNASDTVNVKLSDYGISRQSFHEGALGVEGTPGYQAPEIMPGIVYDEKVDMFSYGMVLYELLSGHRPVLGHHQIQIAKKLAKGLRPSLGLLEEVQFHSLQTLMTECWDTKPEKRPAANSIVRMMQDPSFPVLMYTLSCGRQNLFYSSQEQEQTIIFWDGEGEERNYSVVNIEKGLIEVDRISCPGIRLSCQLKLQTALWIATEDQKIHVYSLKGMCPLNKFLKVLDVPAIVTCFLMNSPLVFAGMADGMVAIYSLASDIPKDGCTYICSRSANKFRFKITDDDPKQNVYQVTDMIAVNNGSEVWYSNGPAILIVDRLTAEIVRRLETYQAPSQITSMVSNLGCNGEEAIWCLDDKTNCLVMYHAPTYQICAHYFCNDCNPLRDMFTIQQPINAVPAIHKEVNEYDTPADVSIIISKEVGTQIIRHSDSVTDYCSMSSCSSMSNRNTRSSFSGLSSPTSPTSIPFSTDCEESDKSNTSPDQPENNVSPTARKDLEHLQAVTVLAVNDTIWIPRRCGDIIVIELENQSGSQRGKVIAVTLVEAAVLGKDTVVCCSRNENREWCLAVWRGWGSKELELFYQSYEVLGRLEINMRKRR
uniref:non-specific serine/threonine protein kinase n=1 Tax=Callorhinchus milii TaxID=7868 RepID=A0A4W3H6W8_CALMI